MDTTKEDEICLLCDKTMSNEEETTVIKQKQIDSFVKKSKAREEDDWQKWQDKSCMKVHENCRQAYSKKRSVVPAKKRKVLEDLPEIDQPSFSITSVSENAFDNVPEYGEQSIDDQSFNFNDNCFICAKPTNKKKDSVHVVTEDCLKYYCRLRSQSNNEEDKIILKRVQNRDPNQECLYHGKCRSKFFSSYIKVDTPKIRHDSQKIDEVAEHVCQYIETSGRFRFSWDEINQVIGDERITNSTFFERLKKRFGDDIYIVQAVGKKPIIFYKISSSENILQRWFLEDGNIDEIEKNIILTAAAEILKKEILSCKQDSDRYPPPANFLDNVESDIPCCTKEFFELIIPSKKVANVKSRPKIDMLCHSLQKLVQPSFSSKLLLALGTYVLRKTGKKQIINVLSKLGLCASYDAIQSFESTAVLNPSEKQVLEDVLMKFVFQKSTLGDSCENAPAVTQNNADEEYFNELRNAIAGLEDENAEEENIEDHFNSHPHSPHDIDIAAEVEV